MLKFLERKNFSWPNKSLRKMFVSNKKDKSQEHRLEFCRNFVESEFVETSFDKVKSLC